MAYGGGESSVSVECCIRGYHVYQRMWNPELGEVAVAVRESGNHHDRYAVAILETDTLCTVGHVPREISKECFYFLRMGGAIKAEVVGRRRRSPLPRGGLEIPCILTFEHKEESMIKQAKEVLRRKNFSEAKSIEHEESMVKKGSKKGFPETKKKTNRKRCGITARDQEQSSPKRKRTE